MRAAGLTGFITFVLFIALPAMAVNVNSLYKSAIPVNTQSAAERHQAIQQALEHVFIKVSGNDQILNNTSLKSRLNTADTLIQQVGYTTPLNKSSASYLLEVQFDPAGVNQWLRDAGVPIWGQNRPLIVAWIAYETPGHPAELLGNDSNDELAALLKKQAEERGLPLMLPVMDMTDLNQVSIKNVTDMATPNLLNATARYASDAILIGRIIQSSDGLTSQWRLVFKEQQWDWNLDGKTLTNIIPLLIGNITTTLAARLAIITTNAIQKDLILKVTGITHYPDFARLTRYLNHLTPVANVEIMKISTDNDVILKISLRSTQESFIQALSLGKTLTKIPTNNTTDTMVTYQWNP
jgi:hypothetical protein